METNGGRSRPSIPGSATFRRLPTLTRSSFRRSEKSSSASPEPAETNNLVTITAASHSSSFPSLARVVVDDSSLSSALFGTPIAVSDEQAVVSIPASTTNTSSSSRRSPRGGTSTNTTPEINVPQPISPAASGLFPPVSPLSPGFKHLQTGDPQSMTARGPTLATPSTPITSSADIDTAKFSPHLVQQGRIPDSSSPPGSASASSNPSPASGSGSTASPNTPAPVVPARSAHRYRDFTLGSAPLASAMNLSTQALNSQNHTPMQSTPSFGAAANGVSPNPAAPAGPTLPSAAVTPRTGSGTTDSPQPASAPPLTAPAPPAPPAPSASRTANASGSRKPSVSTQRRDQEDGERGDPSTKDEVPKRSREGRERSERVRPPPKARERTDQTGTTDPDGDAMLEPVLPSAKVARAPASAMYYSPVSAHGRPPGQALRAHTGTLVGDRIWFIGGVDARSCWRGVAHFDTETLQWTTIEPYGEVLPPIRAHTTTLVGDQLYLFGGGDGPTYSNDVWVFDTITHRWSRPSIASPRGQLPPPRRAHTTVLYRNYLVVFGGGNGQAALNDVWALDVSDANRLTWQEWRTRGDIPHKKGYHTANLVGDKMIVYGGSDGHASFADVHVLDLKTLTWTLVNTEVKHNRLSHTSTQVGSYLFILGGHNGQTYAQDVLLFNLTTLAWESKVPRGIAPPGRGYHVAILHDARIFISGGYNGVSVFDDLWSLDLGAGAYLPQVTSFVVDEMADHLRTTPTAAAKNGSTNRI